MKPSPRPSTHVRGIPGGPQAVRLAFLAFVAWIPVETIFVLQSDDDSPITIPRLLGFVLVALSLFARRTCYKRFPAAFWMLVWYVGVFALSRIWVPVELDKYFTEYQGTMVQMLLLFLISVNLLAEKSFRDRLTGFYGWWTALIAVGMGVGLIGGEMSGAGLAGRTTILDQDPNVAAGFFALGAVCVAGNPSLFARRLFWPRVFLSLAALAVLIAAILQTGSRGGLLVFVAGLTGLLGCGGKATSKARWAATAIVVGLFAFMIGQEFEKGTETALRLGQTVTSGDTAGRTGIWKAAWGMVLDKPLLGWGGANNFSTLGGYLNRAMRDTHNLFLAILTEVGVIGAGPFIAAMFLALWTSWRYGRRTGDALPFALMCCQMAINMSLTGYHQKLFWIFFALATAAGLKEAET